MFTEIGGTKSAYTLSGEKGSPVVLLHGWGCRGQMMTGVAGALEEDHRVLTVDFPGFGDSGMPPEPWGIPEYAAWLKDLMEGTGFAGAAAVGHSFGCRVAAWAASEWPGLFTKLVFTGAAGLRKEPDEAARKRAEEYRKKRKILEGIRKIGALKGIAEKAEESLRQKYGSADYNALDPEMRKTFVKVVNLDLRDWYPLIQAPTLLIWGDMDTETPLWMGREMETLIPDAGLVLLEGGSHFAYLEQALRFNTIVRHFLSEEK